MRLNEFAHVAQDVRHQIFNAKPVRLIAYAVPTLSERLLVLQGEVKFLPLKETGVIALRGSVDPSLVEPPELYQATSYETVALLGRTAYDFVPTAGKGKPFEFCIDGNNIDNVCKLDGRPIPQAPPSEFNLHALRDDRLCLERGHNLNFSWLSPMMSRSQAKARGQAPSPKPATLHAPLLNSDTTSPPGTESDHK